MTIPKLLEVDGEPMTALELAKLLGWSDSAVYALRRQGMSGDEIVRFLRDRKRPCDFAEESALWAGANTLPWEDDLMARAVVRAIGPMTLDTVGACLGLSKERVRQIEEVALRKLRRRSPTLAQYLESA